MGESTMRGMRLGANSLESAVGAALEARVSHSFVCEQQHETTVVFAADAEVPSQWECRTCAKTAHLHLDGVRISIEETAEAVGRSHWQMLLERRTIPELEDILDEQLSALREKRARVAEKAASGF